MSWRRLCCWWFGCDTDWSVQVYDTKHGTGWTDALPCRRCGAADTSYSDRVGDTRHWRAKEWARYWLFRRWWPERCKSCNKRGGDHSGCIPF